MIPLTTGKFVNFEFVNEEITVHEKNAKLKKNKRNRICFKIKLDETYRK